MSTKETEELVFNSNDEAFQMLADVTGKKILIPENTNVETENESIVADERLKDIVESLTEKSEKYQDLAQQVAEADEALGEAVTT